MGTAFAAVAPSAAGSTSTGTAVQTFSVTIGANVTSLLVGIGLGAPSPGTAAAVSYGVKLDPTGMNIDLTQRDPSGGRPTTARGAAMLFEYQNDAGIPAGTYTVQITKTGAASTTTTEGGAITYTGADNIKNIVKNQSTADTTPATVTVTCDGGTNSRVVAMMAAGSGWVSTTGTMRWRANFSTASQGGCAQMTDYAGASPSVATSAGLSADNWSLVAAEVPPLGAAPVAVDNFIGFFV